MALGITEPEAAARRRGRTRPAADRARRAVAFSGGVWYTSHRCAAMGSKTPATKQRHNGIKIISLPCKRSTASRGMSYPFAGRGFFVNGSKTP